MNLDVLYQQFNGVVKGIELNAKFEFPTLVIRGGKSKYVEEKDLAYLGEHFTNLEVVTIANAGHWLHAEAPKEFLDAVRHFLEK